MARNNRNEGIAPEDAATEVAPSSVETTPEVVKEKKPRKPRGANVAKSPAFTSAELALFAEVVVDRLTNARTDASVTNEAMFELFTLDKKLKAMTAGGSNVENS